jgi:hypothetical protein
MSWTEALRATALAVLAERTTTAGRPSASVPWSWNPHDVWLSRIKSSREPAGSPKRGPTAQPLQGTARRGKPA